MNDLASRSGLAISLGGAGKLEFGGTVTVEESVEKKTNDLAPFLLSEPLEVGRLLYRVHKGVCEKEACERVASADLSYDLTILEAGAIGVKDGSQEFVRTAGHYHGAAKNGEGYPEIYEVISGYGRWLIQKPGPSPDGILEAYLIEAGPGEKICVPPGFGHITVNAESTVLVEANANYRSFGHDYDTYRKLQGGCYRFLEGTDSGMIEIEPNPRYSNLPPLRKLKPRKDWFKGYFLPLWIVVRDHPEDIAFLSRPETYNPAFFSISNLYKEIY